MDADDAIRAWPGTRILEPLAGGNRNPVLLCRGWDGALGVLRRSRRDPAALAWELDLLTALSSNPALHVPAPVPTASGTSAGPVGWHLLTYIAGSVLADGKDPRAAAALEALHEATRGWPQRPGARTALELLHHERGGDIDLTEMPHELVRAVRQAWAALPDSERCVVHGDAGPGNAVITPAGDCVLIDWDEARVDRPEFDTGDSTAVRRARLAWEIATCWVLEPAYARSLVPDLLEDRRPQG